MGQEPEVEVDVLGPLQLSVDGEQVPVPGPRRRAVLALLALAEGRAVPVDQLLDALWAGDPPDSGRAALHSHVSRLRGHLGAAAARLQTLDGGYRLALGEAALDVVRARRMLDRGRTAARTDPGAAVPLLREARALWRGPVLADLTEVPPIAASALALRRLHGEVTALLVKCSVESGELDGATAMAAELVADDPLAEPAVRLLIRALAAEGRAAEALRAARGYRRRLAEETGLDPSPGFGELERAVAGGSMRPATVGHEPPVRASAPPASVSAAALPPLFGRDAQLAALHRLVEAERLVTVVGPGGVGKTRVALEVAHRERAATLLRLAPVADPAAVPHALAAALDLRVPHGDVLAACAAVLAAGPRLLVVDNCEHLLDAVRDTVETLLASCPRLTVLATSREPLGLSAECPSRLAPLALPEPGRAAEHSPAVAVFLDRARRVRPGFDPDAGELDLVADVVRRLDGMPLAIELAAGRLTTFSLADLAERLDRALDLLGGGRRSAELRHRTLRATAEWSYDLLPADEQRLFDALSVFADGVDLTTAEHVAENLDLSVDPGSALAHLVDASMIEAVFEGRTRYRMLQTLRAFGRDRLRETGRVGDAEARLLRWAVELATWIDATVVSDREPEADATLRRELGNLRAAWHLARRQDTLDDAVALALALVEASQWRDLPELWSWPDELVADPRLAGHRLAGELLGAAAQVTYIRGNYALAEQRAHDGLARATTPLASWLCLGALALAELSRQAFADVVAHSVAAAAFAPRPTENLGIAALAAAYAGDLGQARDLLARLTAVASSPTLHGLAAYVAGEVDNADGRRSDAERHYRSAIEAGRTSGATFLVGIASVGLVTALAADGRVRDALLGYRDVIDYWAAAGNWTQQWVTLRNLADLLRRLGDHETADLLDAAADAAPDAPPDVRRPAVRDGAPVDRTAALETARHAIARHIAGN